MIRSTAQAAGEEGRDLADALGDSFMSRYSRTFLSTALAMQGKLAEGLLVSRSLVEEARAAGDRPMEAFGLLTLAHALVVHTAMPRRRAPRPKPPSKSGPPWAVSTRTTAYVALANAALAGGDAAAAKQCLRCGMAAHLST